MIAKRRKPSSRHPNLFFGRCEGWSRPLSVLTGMALTLVGTIIVLHFSAPSPRARTAAKIVKSGPWGVVEESTLMLSRPDEAFRQPHAEIIWLFGGATPTQYRALIQSCGLTESQAATLLEPAHW